MTTMIARARIIRHATACGFADYGTMFSPATWFTAYLGRMITQVIFFGIIGLLIENPATVRFLVIGNAVVLVAHEAMQIISYTTWERRAGTLALLVASPSNPLLAFLGRCVQGILIGTGLATITLTLASFILRLDLSWTQVLATVPIVAIIGFATATFSLLLGAQTFRAMGMRQIFTNVVMLTFTAICGVSVPADFWPPVIQNVASLLPVTHGLEAIRTLLDNGLSSAVWKGAGLELAVGLAWLAPSSWAIRILVDGGRRTGTIDFGE